MLISLFKLFYYLKIKYIYLLMVHGIFDNSLYNGSKLYHEPIINVYEEQQHQQLQNLNNEMTYLIHERYKIYDIYNNLIYNIIIMQKKIDVYKNILQLNNSRSISTLTFISLQRIHIKTLLNNQIQMYNKIFKKINKIVHKIDRIDILINKVKFKILFI